MATIKQKRLAEAIVLNTKAKKPSNKQTLLEKVGYATSVAEHKPKEIFESKGLNEELKILGFDSNNAKRVIGEILNKEKAKDVDRIRAAEQVFKVNKDYVEGGVYTLKLVKVDL